LEDLDGVFELGFTIAKQHQRLGYAKESIGALIDYLPTQIKVDKFFAQTDRRNLASIRLLLALNFFPNHSKSYSEQFKGEMVFVEYFERPFQVMTSIGKNVVRD
jgi:RimJ/RimL family protein N-acetyltransferase